MAGHSKWANIKHRKSRMDAHKGKLFTKLAKEILVAAREGGDDLQANTRLRLAVQKARDANMPNDNINRCMQKGLGNLEGETYDEVVYEGYGPGGVAVLIEALTDNKNRTVAELRNVFSKNGGNMGEAGCVAWMFNRKGCLLVNKDNVSMDEDEFMLELLEAGADDVIEEEGEYSVLTAPEDLEKVREWLESKDIKTETAELTMNPVSNIDISEKAVGETVIKLMEMLEDNDDVQNVYSNFNLKVDL